MKRFFVIVLAVCMLLSTCAFAATKQETQTADALARLRLFRGKSTTTKDYALDDGLNRAEGIVMLVRILGQEAVAEAGGDFGMPFADAKEIDWCKGHIGYAWKNGITNGVSDTEFDPMAKMQDHMFLTLVLRAMGYTDKGENAQFTWDKPYELAKRIGLVNTAAKNENFDRGDVVQIVWNALGAKLNGSEETLANQLLSQNVFTGLEYEEAQDIQQYGSVQDHRDTAVSGTTSRPSAPSNPGTPSTPSNPSTPSTPSNPSTPSTPTEPETPVEPNLPEEPEIPAEPDVPAEPDTPSAPQEPARPSGSASGENSTLPDYFD